MSAVASFQWDLETIQELHGSLSHEMQKEAAEVTEFNRAPGHQD